MEDDSAFTKVVDVTGQDSKFRFLTHGKRVKRAGVQIARRVRADHERDAAPDSVSVELYRFVHDMMRYINVHITLYRR